MRWAEDRVFRRVRDGLLVRRGAQDAFAAADSVIFDIDGVLIDTQRSFPVVISDTVQYYFEHVLGIGGAARLFRSEDAHHFTMAGGFNSDWDLTEAVVVFLLYKMRALGLERLEQVVRTGPPVRAFTEALRAAGGGLAGAYAWVTERLSEEQAARLKREVDRPLIRKVFQEHYAGDAYCHRLYGTAPRYYHGPGRILQERVLLDPDLWRPGLFAYGILSGRTPQEIDLALELMHLRVDPDAVIGDDGTHPTKPDPWGLARLAERLDGGTAVYVGDTGDDLRTVLRYRKQAPARPVLFCGCVTGPGPDQAFRMFRAQGADLIARDVNVLLQHLAARPRAGALASRSGLAGAPLVPEKHPADSQHPT